MTVKKPTGSEQSGNQENPVTLEQVKALLDERAPLLRLPDPPTDEEIAEQKQYSMRHNALSYASQVYAGAVPLGESGQRVGEVVVEAAGVIERYLSGNSD